MLESDLRTERAHVDVLAPVRGETDRMLAHQERPLADCACPRCGVPSHGHAPTVADVLPSFPQPRRRSATVICYMFNTYVSPRTRRASKRTGRSDRALPGRRDPAPAERASRARVRPPRAASAR